MKLFNNNTPRLVAFAISASILGVAVPASACIGNQCPTNGTASPAPVTRGFTLQGGALMQGGGAAVFHGQEGFAISEKEGNLNLRMGVNGVGANCTVNCGDVGWHFQATGQEMVRSSAAALDNRSGHTASAANTMVAQGQMHFSFTPSAITAPTTPH